MKDNNCNRCFFLFVEKQFCKDSVCEVGYIYCGAMYRAVTLYSIESGIFGGLMERLKRNYDIHISFR